MATEPDSSRIQPRLSTFDTSMVVFSLVVGIGIFRTPAIVASAAGGTALFFSAWILGGLISLVGALTFAEIGSRHPRAGGYYRVVADCYHPMLAFMLNWSQTLMQGAGAAGVSFIGAEYLMPVILPPEWRTERTALGLACAMMLVLLILNYRGIRPGAHTQNLLSMLKIAMMVGLAVPALLLAGRAHLPEPAATTPWEPRLASALVPCFYAYGGYQMTMNLGADLKEARRRFPARDHGRHADGRGPLSVAELHVPARARCAGNCRFEARRRGPVTRNLRSLRRARHLHWQCFCPPPDSSMRPSADATQSIRDGTGWRTAPCVSAREP